MSLQLCSSMEGSAPNAARTTTAALAALIKEQQSEYRAAQRRAATQQGTNSFVRRADVLTAKSQFTSKVGQGSSCDDDAAADASSIDPVKNEIPESHKQYGRKRQREPAHDSISSDEIARQKRILILRKRTREAAIAAASVTKSQPQQNSTLKEPTAPAHVDEQISDKTSQVLRNESEAPSSNGSNALISKSLEPVGASTDKQEIKKSLPTTKDQVDREDEKTCGKNTRRIFKKFIDEWADDLRNRTDKVKRSALGREESKRFKLCKDNIRPMFKMSREGTLAQDLRNAIRLIAHYIHIGEYVKAHDQYMLLAIGNAAWPIGVTMVGIHARGGRERIQSNKIAHAMDDELTLKYLTSIKRLISYAQKKYPSVPSKMVVM